jgi:hypothetical protein
MIKSRVILLQLSIFLVMLLLAACISSSWTFGWQSVSIDNVGTFKVPREWVVTQENYILYITDMPITNENYKIYLIGSIWNDQEDGNYTPTHKLFDNVEYGNSISSEIFSNSAAWGLNEFIVNGNKENKYYIRFHKHIVIAWDDLINKKTIITIAKSFVLP